MARPNQSRSFQRRLAIAGCAAALALVAALIVMTMPGGLIEAVVGRSGIARLVPAAAPPLGMTARLLIALAAAAGIAAGFVLLMLLLDRRHRLARRKARAARSADVDAPALRRGDAHPDAPARRPLSAFADLGDETADPLPALDAMPLPASAIAAPPIPPHTPAADESLAALVARLDRGLAARGGRPPRPTPAAIAAIDAALQQRLAALHHAA